MPNLNCVQLIGRLADNPVVTTGSVGQTRAAIVIVVNEYWRSANGERSRSTDSFKIRLYGQPASFAAGNLWKGSLVLVCGKLRTEKWTDKNGDRRYAVVVVV